ncbi:MAG: NUDIX domain-containing protein [Rhodospirillales bacterium]|nr:MAG: NUDIX domain-containing protein [Rhodospirillales bacterium]
MSRQYPDFPRVGVGAIIWKNGFVLLIRRAAEPRIGQWSLPGGLQHLGETLAEAITREIREETALIVKLGDVVAVADLIERDPAGVIEYHFAVIDYEADWVFGEPRPGDDAAEAVWADPMHLAPFDLPKIQQDVISKALSRRRNSIVL